MHSKKISGWLLLDKPPGISSAQALNKLKRFVAPAKIGHAGTLDPFASGLMIVAIGEATKLLEHVVAYHKSYTFTISWGVSTDTLDPTGEIISQSDFVPAKEELQEILSTFQVGQYIMQRPPQYSAIKINGKRAYALARAGQDFVIPERPVLLKSLELISHEQAKTVLSVSCGKGFYIRSLARDIIEKTKGYGHVLQLQRESIGKFTITQSIKLDYLLDLLHNSRRFGDLLSIIKPVHALLDDILVLHVNEFDAKALRLGKAVALLDKDLTQSGRVVVCESSTLSVVALCEVQLGYLKPRRILNFI